MRHALIVLLWLLLAIETPAPIIHGPRPTAASGSPIAIDASSPVRKTGTPAINTDSTSASFTPPNNSILVTCVSADTTDNTTTTISVTATTGTSPVERVVQNGASGVGTGGYAAIWTSVVTTGASMTVSARFTANRPNSGRLSFKVYVVTAGDTTTPNGASQSGTSTVNNLTSTAYTSTVNNSRGFGVGTEWNALGSPTSTDTGDAEHDAGQISLISVYKASNTTPNSSSVSMNFDASGTAAAIWHWATLEIRPAP